MQSIAFYFIVYIFVIALIFTSDYISSFFTKYYDSLSYLNRFVLQSVIYDEINSKIIYYS